MMKIAIGDSTEFSKTVTDADIATFVALSGDDYEAHTSDEFMKSSSFGRRIAHGALLVGFMSAAGTRMIRLMKERGDTTTPVSLGYEKMRFVAPVFPGDTITVRYAVIATDQDRARSTASLEVINQTGTTVAVAEHIMKWLSYPIG